MISPFKLIQCYEQGLVKRETRFASRLPANEILSKIEEAATPFGFKAKKNNYKVAFFPFQCLCLISFLPDIL
jgi:NAF domain